MSFIEELRSLESAVSNFDKLYSSYDFSTLSDTDLNEGGKTHLPLWKVNDKISQERMDRATRLNQERRAEFERLKVRYGYRFPDKEDLTAMNIHDAKIAEEEMISFAFMYMDEMEAKKIIHKRIPTISDDEIDKIRIALMEE